MASFTVTVPDAVVPRIRAAFAIGGVDATNQQLMDALKAWLRERVIASELSASIAADTASRNAETWA